MSVHNLSSRDPEWVSVIIPCYNGEAYLEEAIQSVLRQTYPKLEILVIDDGSTDATAAIVQRYPQVRYLPQENRGISATRNRGIAESRGANIVFLDHDDLLLPEAIAIGMAHLQQHPEAGFVFGRNVMIDAQGEVIIDRPQEWVDRADYRELIGGRLAICPPSTVLFRRTALEQVGGFGTEFEVVEDFDLYLRIAREFPISCHNQIVAKYRCHGGNISGNVFKMLDQSMRLFDQHKSWVDAHPTYLKAWREGKRSWRDFWTVAMISVLIQQIKRRRWDHAKVTLRYFVKYPPHLTVFSDYLSRRWQRYQLAKARAKQDQRSVSVATP